MRTKVAFFGLPVIGALGAFLLLPASTAAQEQQGAAEKEAQIDRGEYLVTAMDCTGCHTPLMPDPDAPYGIVPDTTMFLAGHPSDVELPEVPEGVLGSDKWGGMWPSRGAAFVGPWGISFPRNLTPDVETGLGSWTAEIFIKALRTGKDMGEGRDILPIMPWYQFRELTDEDLRAIFAYLGSIEPIENAVPDPISPTGERIETLRKPPD